MALVVGEAALQGDADVAASTTVAFTTAAGLDGDSDVYANLLGIFEGRVDYQGDTQLTVAPGAIRQSDVELFGDAGLTLADVYFVLNADVDGDADLGASASAIYAGGADLQGGVEITAEPLLVFGAGADLDGEGVLDAAAIATFVGATALDADAILDAYAYEQADPERAADLFGESEVSATMNVAYEASHAFSGSTVITVHSVLRKPRVARPAAPTEAAPDPFPGLNPNREPPEVRHSWKIKT